MHHQGGAGSWAAGNQGRLQPGPAICRHLQHLRTLRSWVGVYSRYVARSRLMSMNCNMHTRLEMFTCLMCRMNIMGTACHGAAA